MNTLYKVGALTVVPASVAGCYSRTREVVREQPIVQQQPVIERQTVVQQPVAQEPRVVERERVVLVQQPAAPVEQVPPAPAPTGYSWVAGHYERHRPGHYYAPARWVHRDGHYYYSAGGGRTNDRDGVPNRYDRAPNNPYYR